MSVAVSAARIRFLPPPGSQRVGFRRWQVSISRRFRCPDIARRGWGWRRGVTLCVKQITSDAIDGTREIEVHVGDFATANALLGTLGFTPKSYQENKRTSFTLDGARLEIDSWPGIPPYLEIEADTKGDVIRVAELLGHTEADLTGENTTKVYARHGIDLDDIPELRF
jgi:adenylate cyclase class 2